MNLLVVMLLSAVVGGILAKVKVPNGFMLGTMLTVVVCNLFWQPVTAPASLKIISHIIIGGIIGIGVCKDDLKVLKYIFKPIVIMIIAMFLMNLVLGLVLYYTTDLDAITSFLSIVPGGVTTIPLIAYEMGANTTYVSIMQFLRLFACVGIFPTIITWLTKNEHSEKSAAPESTPYTHKGFIIAMAFATAGGLLGRLLSFPSSILLFSMIFTAVGRNIFPQAVLPPWIKRLAQITAGTVIAASFTMEDLAAAKFLIVPSIITIAGYFIFSVALGRVMYKMSTMNYRESLLSVTPAGVPDMVLIATEMGSFSPEIVAVQMFRMIFTIFIFPNIFFTIVQYMF